MIITANIVGGGQHAHRSAEVAARRVATNSPDGYFGGIVAESFTGVHAEIQGDQFDELVARIREDFHAGYYDE